MKALEGMVVIDFTQAYSGPFCTMQLADFGATVIKIERPYIGDQSREWGPIKDNYSGYFASINRNKLGLALDMASEEGGNIIKKLAKTADVIVENFKVGTMEKYGLGYEEIKKINPGIIYASISGFGQDSTLKKSPAYDNVIQSMTGLQDMTGFPNKSGVRCGSAIGDSFTGMNCAYAILMAYLKKLNTGEGERIDVGMFDSIFGILEPHILAETISGVENTRAGNSDENIFSPCDVYECKDGWFSIGIISDDEFMKLCDIIQKEELATDARFATNRDRSKNGDELTDSIKGFFKDKTRSELEKIFTGNNIINAPLLTIPEIMEHPQLKARKMTVKIKDSGIGEYITTGNPMKMTETPASYEMGAPLLGEHTQKILKSLGYSKDEMKKLCEEKVIQY